MSALAENTENVLGQEDALELAQRHYWCGAWSRVRPVLEVCPGEVPATAFLRFFDSRGEMFNSLVCEFSEGEQLELVPFFEACRLESGVQHAHLELLISPGASSRVIHLSDRGAQLQSGTELLGTRVMKAYPFSVEHIRQSFFCFCSTGGGTSTAASRVKIKLPLGKRAPEAALVIPAGASRLISLDSLFTDLDWDLIAEQQSHVCLRLGLKDGSPVMVSTLEVQKASAGQDILMGVS